MPRARAGAAARLGNLPPRFDLSPAGAAAGPRAPSEYLQGRHAQHDGPVDRGRVVALAAARRADRGSPACARYRGHRPDHAAGPRRSVAGAASRPS